MRPTELDQGSGAAPQGSVVAVALATAAPVAPAAVPTDPQRLRGVWQLVSLTNDGQKASEHEVRDVRLEYHGKLTGDTITGTAEIEIFGRTKKSGKWLAQRYRD